MGLAVLSAVRWLAPSTETGRIQEGHIAIGHALMELIEDGLIAREAIKRC